MIVVDSSVVVVALADDGQDGDVARNALLADSLVAPALLDLEVLAVLRRLEQSGKVLEKRALLAAEDLFDLAIERVPERELVPEIWGLRHNLPAYGAAYVALAQLLDVPLLTADERLAKMGELGCQVNLLKT